MCIERKGRGIVSRGSECEVKCGTDVQSTSRCPWPQLPPRQALQIVPTMGQNNNVKHTWASAEDARQLWLQSASAFVSGQCGGAFHALSRSTAVGNMSEQARTSNRPSSCRVGWRGRHKASHGKQGRSYCRFVTHSAALL